MGPRNLRGVPTWVRCPHANAATVAFGGVPYGATKRVRGVPKWGGSPCGRSHWGLWWSSLWGHETCEGSADMGRVTMRTRPLMPSVELPMGPRNV